MFFKFIISDKVAGSSRMIDFEKVELGHMSQDDNHLRRHTGFVGAMQQFLFNSNKFFEMAKLRQIDNIKVTARFDSEEHVLRHPVTFKSAAAYATLPQLQAHSLFALYFMFKTTETQGLLLYQAGQGQDFLALELDRGYLYYAYDVGSGAQRSRVNPVPNPNDNMWHDVALRRKVGVGGRGVCVCVCVVFRDNPRHLKMKGVIPILTQYTCKTIIKRLFMRKYCLFITPPLAGSALRVCNIDQSNC
jgi:hypothetical protein